MLYYLSFLFNISTALADEESEDIRVFVKGMVCSFCVQGVEKQFKKQEANIVLLEGKLRAKID